MTHTKNGNRLQKAPGREDDWMYERIIPNNAFSTRPIDLDGGDGGGVY